MGLQNSEVILAKNIKMDKDYNNVINYAEADLVSLVRDNQVASASNFSFIRNTNKIQVPFNYGTCLSANYVAFQNPNYNNKWFFAFITKIEYKGDNNTEIEYTVDVWSTWFSYWNVQPCYVLREHVNDDTIGANTVPENLDIGEVRQYDELEDISLSELFYIAISSSWNPATSQQFSGVTMYNKNLFANEIFVIPGNDEDTVKNLMLFILKCNTDNHINDIKDIFIVPDALFLAKDLTLQTGTVGGQNFNFYKIAETTTNVSINSSIGKLNTFPGYIPKNNKCLVYPYNYILASNNNGSYNIYKYEDFSGTEATFKIDIAMSIGGSGRLVPTNYKGELTNDDESLPLGKYPIVGWSADSYVNWLTQNSVNLSGGLKPLKILGNITNSVSKGNIVGGTIGAINDIASLIGEFQEAKCLPNIGASDNTGDVSFASGRTCFTLRRMQCKLEYIKIIDDYFSRYGYKINRIKTPNITGRPIFNYIEIASNDAIGTGSVPSEYMDIINNICRKGVTIWHSHTNIQNYTLNNKN